MTQPQPQKETRPFTLTEYRFLVNIFGQLKVAPTDPNAIATCQTVQSILGKADQLTDKETEKSDNGEHSSTQD